MPLRSREIRLAARPRGLPVPTDFELAEVELPDPVDGQVLVRNAFVSVDPYMRARMNDVRSYVPPFAVGEPLTGGAVGQVVASAADAVPEGGWVVHDLGWREAAVLDSGRARPVDPSAAPLSTALGVLHKAEGVALRATFIVDPDGIIRWVSVNDLSVGRNVPEVLRTLDALQTDELCPCNWQKGQPTLEAA